MRCNEAGRLIQRDIDGDLSKEEQHTLSVHLAHCAQCRHEYDQMQSLSDQLRSLPKVDPPHSIVDKIIPHIQEGDHSSAAGGTLPHDSERQPQHAGPDQIPDTKRNNKQDAVLDRAQNRQKTGRGFAVLKRHKGWVTTGTLAACALVLVLLFASDALYPNSGNSLLSTSEMGDEAAEQSVSVPEAGEEGGPAQGAEGADEDRFPEPDAAQDGAENDVTSFSTEVEEDRNETGAPHERPGEAGTEESSPEPESGPGRETDDNSVPGATGEGAPDEAGDGTEEGADNAAGAGSNESAESDVEGSVDAGEPGDPTDGDGDPSVPTRSSVFDPADDDNVLPSPDRMYTAYQGFGEDDIRVDKEGDPYILSRNPPTPMWEVEWMEWVTDDKLYYVMYHHQKDERQYWVLDVVQREEIQLERPHPLSSTYRPQEESDE